MLYNIEPVEDMFMKPDTITIQYAKYKNRYSTYSLPELCPLVILA